MIYLYKSNPYIFPPCVHRNLRRYIEGGSKSQYCIIGKFCSQFFAGAKFMWRPRGVRECYTHTQTHTYKHTQTHTHTHTNTHTQTEALLQPPFKHTQGTIL